MKTRSWISIVLVALLLLSLMPVAGAQAAGVQRKAHYKEGEIIELRGILSITQEPGAGYFAILALDEKVDFIGLTDADGMPKDYVGVTDIQVQVPNKHSGKHVSVKGKLIGSYGVDNPRRAQILKDATATLIPAAKSVKLSKAKATLNRGATLELKATVKPAKADQIVTWTSGNAAVASVDAAGLVAALSPGTATITAKTANGKKASCKITVKVPVEGVSLNSAVLSMKKRDKTTLVATVAPGDATNKKLTWKSSKRSVATVSAKGVVIANKKGEAVITATTKDGGFAATCTVYVDTPPPGQGGVEKIRLEPSSVTLNPGRGARLLMILEPADGDFWPITWASSDPSVASVDNNGYVQAHKVGSATVTVTSGNGAKGSCAVSVTATPTPVLEDLWLEPTPLTLKPGETKQMEAGHAPQSAPAPSVQWVSANPAVATVSQTGLVTAVGEGATSIFAKTGLFDIDGNRIIGCAAVMVSANAIPDFVPQGASDLLLKGNPDLQLPITLAQAKAKIPDAEIKTYPGDEITYFYADGLQIHFESNGDFKTAFFFDSDYTTNRGIGRNSTPIDVLRAYGVPSFAQATFNDVLGGTYHYRFSVDGVKYFFNVSFDVDMKHIYDCLIGIDDNN